ncbi:MAG: asparagine synthase (glutamine-hydrolyzing), partial [Candidatus Aenigmarchaeota archaeon]|nr:asparagine synthase (glutamine-hydrolyzing) [Candidatus Aenigmarchaeota archaeon]
AFAIWDANTKTLFAARDRLGEKPFYYTVAGNAFVFASEIKSILVFPGIKRKINARALDKFLSLRYCPGNETMVSGIFRLMPGHWLKLGNGKLDIKSYWDFGPGEIKYETENYYKSMLLKILEDSVRMRLVSEVPIGIYLSGGLDSSAITALASRSAEPIKTFSVGFGENQDNEFEYARLVSERFNTEHSEITVDSQSFDKLPEIIWHADEPLGDPTLIPTYFISQETKKHATVVLTGEGADELFSGYFHEKAMLLADGALSRINLPGNAFSRMLSLTPDFALNKIFEYPGGLGEAGRLRVKRFFQSFPDRARMYSTFVENFSIGEKAGIVEANVTMEDTRGFFSSQFSKGNEVSQKMLAIDREMWLPDYILLRLDRMTMSKSIEGRVPYLDHRLMEMSMSMPKKLKLNGTTEKFILRKSMKGILPNEILKRKKRPFITPVGEWGGGSMLDAFDKLFGKSEFKRGDLLNRENITKLAGAYEKSKLIVGRQMFSLIAFELWARIFMDMEPKEWKSGRIKL